MSITSDIQSLRKPQTSLSVLDPIKNRFSPRVFSPEPIPEHILEIIFEAARLAPSGRNRQPWQFYTVLKDTPEYDQLLTSVSGHNSWAKTAPLIIVSCYDPTDAKDGTNRWAQYDLGAAVISLTLQAQQLGYYSRQIGSFNPDPVKTGFNIPDPWLPFILIAMGKIGTESDYQHADPEIVQKDRTPSPRKSPIHFPLTPQSLSKDIFK